MSRKPIHKCPTCGQNTSERQIAIFDGMVRALNVVWNWCNQKGRYEFERKEIKHLFTNENATARFGDWILAGGLLYRPETKDGKKKGHYGFNIERTKAFFQGNYAIPTIIWKNPITGALRHEAYKTIKEMPKLVDLLDTNREYKTEYRMSNLWDM